jgi:hypothetical protein
VVAHRDHPLGEVARAGDGEVPSEVRAVARDAGPFEIVEDVLPARTPRLDRRAESVPEVAEPDDVAMAVFEVARWADDEELLVL